MKQYKKEQIVAGTDYLINNYTIKSLEELIEKLKKENITKVLFLHNFVSYTKYRLESDIEFAKRVDKLKKQEEIEAQKKAKKEDAERTRKYKQYLKLKKELNLQD